MAYEVKENNKSEYQNDWALNIKEVPIHISNAKSGAQGYYCMGCGEEMQGVKFKNPKYQSYFRHHVSNIDNNKIECVVASRKYRERIASAILNRLQYVKVPTLYKYPPKGIETLPMLLDQSKIINAAYVKSELTFYENKEGNINWGKNPDIKDRYLLIRPDVTFFDKKDNPILFIEFVVTHNLDIEKVSKLNRMGINTLQIIIPKVPEALIEEAIKSVRKYKWVYNEHEANTKYVSVSKGNTEEVSSIDEQQRKLFEESVICRTAKINELIRAIEKCLQSESYNRNERLFDSEIARVTQNAERAKQGLEDLEESNRRDAIARNSIEEDYEEKKYADLEKRYLTKNGELTEAINIKSSDQEIRKRITDAIKFEKAEIDKIESEAINFEAEVRERIQDKFSDSIRREKEEIESLEETIRTSIGKELDATNSDIEFFGLLHDDIPEATTEKFRKQIESLDAKIERIGEQERELQNTVFSEFSENIKFEESEIERIRREEENIEESARKEFDREIKNKTRGLSKTTRDLLEGRELVYNFKDADCKEKSYRAARKFFDKRAWEKE